MTLRVDMVTINARDARSLAKWWAKQIRGHIVADNEGSFLLVAPHEDDGGLVLAFQQVPEEKLHPGNVHLDLSTPDREAEVARLLEAGASFVARHDTPDHSWVVLADPEGNDFCVSTDS